MSNTKHTYQTKNQNGKLTAAEELKAASQTRDSDPQVVFAVLLDDWVRLDYQRERVRTQYVRTQDLRRHEEALSGNLDAMVAEYARISKEMDHLEGTMVDLLSGIDDTTLVDQIISGQHYIPDKGLIHTPRPSLQDMLREALKNTEGVIHHD